MLNTINRLYRRAPHCLDLIKDRPAQPSKESAAVELRIEFTRIWAQMLRVIPTVPYPVRGGVHATGVAAV